MAENVQFNPVFDADGLAQFGQVYTLQEELPPSPTGVAGWVAYTGNIPELRLSDDAPITLLCVQIWTRTPTKAQINDLY